MATPNQEAVETFMSITGASEGVAFLKLEEHGGDLNEAVNSYFSQGDGSITYPPLSRNDFMDIDNDSIGASHRILPFQLLSFVRNFRQSFLDGISIADFTSGAPRVTHPRELGEILIEFMDDNTQSSHSGLCPAIEDVTGTPYAHGPETHGTVTMDDVDEDIQTDPSAYSSHRNETEVGFLGDRVHGRNHTLSAPAIDSVTDYSYDIEEEMIRAAIEASKREVVDGLPNQPSGVIIDSSGPSVQQIESHIEDPDLARAVSLSLKTADEEKASREHGGMHAGIADQSVSVCDSDELGNKTVANGSHGIGSFNKASLTRPKKLEAGSSSVQDEVEDIGEQPLVRQRSRRSISGSNFAKEASKVEDSKPSSLEPHDIGRHPQTNGAAFPSDEWGGISSEEHDEAVMLEAALFGGIPETTAYRFGYLPQERLQMCSDRSYPQPVPRPPSPNLEAQRLLRVQQDDEYLASLQADKEKELKAVEEAEARRLSEKAAREATLEEERRKEEESRRKLLKEEELERQLTAKEASLPVEPASSDDNALTLLVRMPDGNRCGRRFLKSNSLQSVFDFIDIGRSIKPGTYRLVRPYPRRAFSDADSKLSLSELGLTGKQEALFLELI